MPTENEIDEFVRGMCVDANIEINLCRNIYCDEGHAPEQCYDANGDVDVDWCACDFCVEDGEYIPKFRDIQLADILLALPYEIQEKLDMCIGYSIFQLSYKESRAFWNLKLPYHAQDIEVKRFIYNLLKQ